MKINKSKKKSDLVVSNNSQNVTVGTLADAQKPDDVRKGGNGKVDEENGKRKDRYVYCDFARIEEEEYDVDYEIDQEGLLQALDESTTMAAAQTVQHQSVSYLQQPPPVLRASGWVRSQRFPTKLYALLSQPQLSSIITWMPHGRGWKVLKPRVFETSVLPVFFESDNYHSFNRVINAWSFRRKSTGPDRGSYFHELFLRGKPHLQKYMRRLPRTHKKLAMAKTEEPDFFELAKTSPLPTLEQARANLESRKVRRLREQLKKDTTGQGRISDRIVPSLAKGTSRDLNVLDQSKQNLKHTEAWLEDHGNLTAMVKKDAVDQLGLGMNRGVGTMGAVKLPDTMFRLQQQDDLQQQQMLRQQQEQMLLARHRAQMEQQFLQGVHQADFALHQQQNQMNLLRQMDFLNGQRGPF